MKRPWVSLGSVLLVVMMIVCFVRTQGTFQMSRITNQLSTSLLVGDTILIQGTIKNRQTQYGKTVVYLHRMKISNDGLAFRRVHFMGKFTLGEEKSDLAFGTLGDHLTIIYKEQAYKEPRNEGEFNRVRYDVGRGIGIQGDGKVVALTPTKIPWQQGLDNLRKKWANQLGHLLPEVEQGTLATMLLGDKEGLEESIRVAYQLSGLSHVLAISGLHVTLIGMGLFRILRLVKMPRKPAAIMIVIMMSFYCLLTGGQVSTIRASMMLGLQMGKYFHYRRYDSLSALFFCLFVNIMIWPLSWLQLGFQLSYLAVFGIVGIYPKLIEPKLNTLVIPKEALGLLKTIGMMMGIYVATLPVVLSNFYGLPTYGLIVNLIVVPLMGIVIGLGVLGLMISGLSLTLAQGLIGGAYYLLAFIDKINTIVAHLPMPWLVMKRPSLLFVLIYIGGIVMIFKPLKTKRKQLVILSSLLLVYLSVQVVESQVLRMTFLDVGQGDAIVVEYKNRFFLIDGGGQRQRTAKNTGLLILDPYLRSKGCKEIEAIFVTHSDYDHIYGIIEILEVLPCKIVYLPQYYIDNPDDMVERLMMIANQQGVLVAGIERGDVYRYLEFELTCLAPYEDIAVISNDNERSLVLKTAYRDFEMLLMGDAESLTEQRLMEEVEIENVDYIKVGHHGSKSSSTQAFIERVRPKVGVISVGENNSYGHPHPSVLYTYDVIACDLYMTKDTGQIDIYTLGKEGLTLCIP